MKLLSCHIENFGKLSNEDFTFDSDLTALCRENGYGKTTLASFLRAMFYGLDSDRANSAFNDRRKYFPFSGGRFGGNLTFEAEGAVYKIERFFDERSETRDSLTVYRNGQPVALGEVGKRFFGIDRQSFDRTVFVTNADIELSATGDIGAKLNGFAQGTDVGVNFERAYASLEEKSKEYKKSKSGNDLLSKREQRLSRLSEEIKNKETIANSLPEKYQKFNELKEEVARLGEEISRAQSKNVLLAAWEHYDGLKREVSDREQELAKIAEKYPHGYPERGEAEQVREFLGQERALSAKLSKKSFTEEDAEKLSAFEREFSQGIPTEEELDEVRGKIDEAAKLSYELSKTDSPSDRELALKQKFSTSEPDREKRETVRQRTEAFRAAEKNVANLSAGAAQPASEPKKGKKLFMILAAAFLLLAVGGIAVTFVQTVAGIILLGVGLVGAIAMGFLYLNQKSAAGARGEDPALSAAQRQREAALTELRALLVPYGYSFERGAEFAAASFEEDVKEYFLFKEREEKRETERRESAERRDVLLREIENFLGRFQIPAGEISARMKRLTLDTQAFRELKNRQERSAGEERKTEEEIAEISEKIRAFCEKYSFDQGAISENIDQICSDRERAARLRGEIADRAAQAEAFRTEKGLGERPEGEPADLGLLNEKLGRIQDEKNSLSTHIESDEREAESLEGLQSEYEEEQKILAKYRADYDLLKKTMDCLKRADGVLKDKYIKPVKDQFLYYSALLEDALGEKMTMAPDFSVSFERNGKERSDKHLSAGLKSLCALCFRLALIDNMYEKEKPFVILDDPFVNLDGEHLEKAKKLLVRLSKKMQIIYFCCHESRAMNETNL